MQKLYIVCGLPGTGKTTLAKELSKKLNIVCIHKDSIKENLYVILGMSTLEESKKVGLQSMLLLYRLAEEQLANGLDLIIEAPFYFEEDYQIFRNWESKFKLQIYSIMCTIDDEDREKRFINRKRHKGHHDGERKTESYMQETIYKNLPGKIIKIATNKSVTELVNQLVPLIK